MVQYPSLNRNLQNLIVPCFFAISFSLSIHYNCYISRNLSECYFMVRKSFYSYGCSLSFSVDDFHPATRYFLDDIVIQLPAVGYLQICTLRGRHKNRNLNARFLEFPCFPLPLLSLPLSHLRVRLRYPYVQQYLFEHGRTKQSSKIKRMSVLVVIDKMKSPSKV